MNTIYKDCAELLHNDFYLSSTVDGNMGLSPTFSSKLAVNHFSGKSHHLSRLCSDKMKDWTKEFFRSLSVGKFLPFGR